MKSEFKTKLSFNFENGIRTGWFGRDKDIRIVRLNKPLVYYSKLLGKDIIVPSGFGSDGASVPQIFWNIYPPFGKYLEAAVIHDYFYYLGRHDASWVSKETADLIFKEAMEVLGISKINRNVMYKAVALFGYEFDKKVDDATVV
jgi:hypothetical protein